MALITIDVILEWKRESKMLAQRYEASVDDVEEAFIEHGLGRVRNRESWGPGTFKRWLARKRSKRPSA